MTTERGSGDIEIWLTDGNGRETDDPAGTLALMGRVLSINGISAQKLTEEAYALGDKFVFFESVGVTRVGDIQLEMFLDTTPTTGNYAVMTAGSEYRTFKIRYSTDDTEAPNRMYQKMDIVIRDVNITTNKGEKVKLTLAFQPNSDMATGWE